ncbi:MAG: CBS domain-containing protein [Deltaproteobacteria bacterium]|nr:CBS domain-containing protein [Deltaproteobacteria bacterium]
MQVVTTHKNTDFDGLASVVAATILYPGAVPVLPRSINPNVKAFLSIHKDLFEIYAFDDIDLEKVKRLIVVDINSWGRLGRIGRVKNRNDLEVILWDHHSNEGDIQSIWRCQEEVGATITLMSRELKNQRKVLTPIQATLFLTGLYEDTGNLTFPSTTAEDAHAAAYLLERKADLNIISSFLRPAYGEKQKNILFEMLQNAKRKKIKGYKVSVNTLNIKGHVDSLAVVVRMYREILNVDAAFGIFYNQERKNCMIIGRSNTEGIDIGSIMRGLGGGGHPSAGSAMLKAVNPDTVEDMVKDLIEGKQKSSIQISDLMSFPVFTVPSNTKMGKVAALLKKKGCTGVPVVEDGKLVGIISRRDFKKIKKESQLKSPVKAFMSPNVITISPGISPMKAARMMVNHDVGRLPVVENGNIIGIITRSDTMLYFYDLLPD